MTKTGKNTRSKTKARPCGWSGALAANRQLKRALQTERRRSIRWQVAAIALKDHILDPKDKDKAWLSVMAYVRADGTLKHRLPPVKKSQIVNHQS